MMSHSSSPSRIVVVWLVLVAFLCCLMVPSVALAKKERTIATEGDPEDGLGATGGGNGMLLNEDSSSLGISRYDEVFSENYQFNKQVPLIGIFILYPIPNVFSLDHFSYSPDMKFHWRKIK